MTQRDFEHENRIAIIWTVTAVGAALYTMIRVFGYANFYIAGGGKEPTQTFTGPQMLAFGLLSAVWILPPLIALGGFGRPGAWAVLILGGLLVAMNTLGGVLEGIHDGSYIIVTAVIGITIPGVFATIASFSHVRGVNKA